MMATKPEKEKRDRTGYVMAQLTAEEHEGLMFLIERRRARSGARWSKSSVMRDLILAEVSREKGGYRY
jgi:hypothetical protein